MAYRLCFVCSQQIQGYFEFSSKKQTTGGTLCQLLKLPLNDNTLSFGPKFLQVLYCSECVNKLKDIHKMLMDLKELERKIEDGRKHIEDQLQKSCLERSSLKKSSDDDDDDDKDDSFHSFDRFRENVVREINSTRNPWSVSSSSDKQPAGKNLSNNMAGAGPANELTSQEATNAVPTNVSEVSTATLPLNSRSQNVPPGGNDPAPKVSEISTPHQAKRRKTEQVEGESQNDAAAEVVVEVSEQSQTDADVSHLIGFVPMNTTFAIKMSLKCSYKEMASQVGQRIGVDPLGIRFYKARDSKAFPVHFERDGTTDLLTIFGPNHNPTGRPNPYSFLYRVLDCPVPDPEHKKQFKLLYYNRKEEREIVFHVPKQPRLTVKDVLAELSRVVSEEQKPLKNLRMVDILMHRIAGIIEDDVNADVVCDNYADRYFRAEEICAEDTISRPDEFLVQVAHFHKETRSTFGVPFFFVIRSGETWRSVKQRVQARLAMNEKDWAKVRVGRIELGTANFIVENAEKATLKVEDFTSSSKNSGGFFGRAWIGVEHTEQLLSALDNPR